MDKKLKYVIFRSDDQHKVKSDVQQFIKDKEVEKILWTYSEIEELYKAIVYYLISYASTEDEK